MMGLTALLQIVGATILAFNTEWSFVGYWIMCIGCVAGLDANVRFMKSYEMAIMWGFFFVINLIGIWRYTPW